MGTVQIVFADKEAIAFYGGYIVNAPLNLP